MNLLQSNYLSILSLLLFMRVSCYMQYLSYSISIITN